MPAPTVALLSSDRIRQSSTLAKIHRKITSEWQRRIGLELGQRVGKCCPAYHWNLLDEASITQRRIQEIHWIVEHPMHSNQAFIFSSIMFMLIGIAVFISVIETLQEPPEWITHHSSVVQPILFSLFAVEVLLRIITFSSFKRFLLQSPINAIDVLCIMLFAISLARVNGTGIIKLLGVLRVLRLARGFKMMNARSTTRYGDVLERALMMSGAGIVLLIFLILVLAVISSALVFEMEKGSPQLQSDGSILYFRDVHLRQPSESTSPFTSAFATLWWALSSITQTGVGDMVTTSWQGEIVACITVLSGIVVMACSIAIIMPKFGEAIVSVHADDQTLKDEIVIARKLMKMIRTDINHLKLVLKEHMEPAEYARQGRSLNVLESLYTRQLTIVLNHATLIEQGVRMKAKQRAARKFRSVARLSLLVSHSSSNVLAAVAAAPGAAAVSRSVSTPLQRFARVVDATATPARVSIQSLAEEAADDDDDEAQ